MISIGQSSLTILKWNIIQDNKEYNIGDFKMNVIEHQLYQFELIHKLKQEYIQNKLAKSKDIFESIKDQQTNLKISA